MDTSTNSDNSDTANDHETKEVIQPAVATETTDKSTEPKVTTTPVAAPAVAPPPQENTTPVVETANGQLNNPISLMLQWLTYAFWGWFALSLLWLASITTAFMVVGSSSADWTSVIAYPIAAVIVLFIVAGVVDYFYARREPAHKQGFATAIMVIHVVLFALSGIGAAITAVFSLVSLMLNGGLGDTQGKATLAALLVSLLMVFVYLLLIARTTLVPKIRKISLIASGILGGLAVLFIILGIVGPVAQSVLTRQDRQLESALPQIPSAVDEYVQKNKKLPASLSDVSFDNVSTRSSDEVKDVINKGLVKYTPNTSSTADSANALRTRTGSSSTKSTDLLYKLPGNTTYNYKLCVTWQAEKNYDQDEIRYASDSSGALSYISAYSHKKGEQCYNLESSSYDYSVQD